MPMPRVCTWLLNLELISFYVFFGGKGSIPSTVVAVRRFIVVYVTIFHFRGFKSRSDPA